VHSNTLRAPLRLSFFQAELRSCAIQ
jgi:hypothetical protein